MKIFNLYSGLGGNRRKWGNNHEITSIEQDLDIAEFYHSQYPKDKRQALRNMCNSDLGLELLKIVESIYNDTN